MKTHTLLIHQVFVTKDDPGGTRHYELGRRLVAMGQKFTVIASDVSYVTGRRIVPQKRLMTESSEDGIRVLRAFTCAPPQKSYLLRVVSFLSFMASSVIVGLRAGRPDLVMGTTPPIFQAVSAWTVSAIYRRPFLLEVRDLWPEFAIDIGLLKNPWLIRMARAVESFLYRKADHILVNSPAYRDYLMKKSIAPDKISFIANGVDPELFQPEAQGEEMRVRYGLQGKFVATYAGAIGLANDLDTLVDAAALLAQHDNIRILVVGEGKEKARLEERVRREGIDNIFFVGALPKSQMPSVLAASDACVAILRNIKMFTTTYPNKVFDYMAAARPTVLAIDGVIRQVVEDGKAGVFVPPGDAIQMAAAIERLASNPDEARQMGRSAREYVVRHFHRDQHGRELAELLSRLATSQARQ